MYAPGPQSGSAFLLYAGSNTHIVTPGPGLRDLHSTATHTTAVSEHATATFSRLRATISIFRTGPATGRVRKHMSIPNEETRQAHIHATAATTCPPEITATMLQHMHATKQTKNTTDVAARHIFFLCFFCFWGVQDPWSWRLLHFAFSWGNWSKGILASLPDGHFIISNRFGFCVACALGRGQGAPKKPLEAARGLHARCGLRRPDRMCSTPSGRGACASARETNSVTCARGRGSLNKKKMNLGRPRKGPKLPFSPFFPPPEHENFFRPPGGSSTD